MSWRTFEEVVSAQATQKRPRRAARKNSQKPLRPVLKNVKLPAEAGPAASEEHPGPILEDETLEEEESENHECEDPYVPYIPTMRSQNIPPSKGTTRVLVLGVMQELVYPPCLNPWAYLPDMLWSS